MNPVKFSWIIQGDYAALATAPIVEQLVELDLSMGNLSAAGAVALLKSPVVQALDVLDLSATYLRGSSLPIDQLPCLVRLDELRSAMDEDEDEYCYCCVRE
jgi:hypothetical protein